MVASPEKAALDRLFEGNGRTKIERITGLTLATDRVPYYGYFDSEIVPESKFRDFELTVVLRGVYFNLLYWAWFSGDRTPKGYPQVTVSPTKLCRVPSEMRSDPEFAGFPRLTRKTFFRWLAQLQKRDLIIRQRVKGGVRISLWVPPVVLADLTDMEFDAYTRTVWRQRWRRFNYPNEDVPMVELEDRDTLNPTIGTHHRDTLGEDRDTLKVPKVHKGIDDTRLVTSKNKETVTRRSTNNHMSLGPVTGPSAGTSPLAGIVPAADLELAMAKAKAKSVGRPRFPVTKQKPLQRNIFTREYSQRWWADMIAEHRKVPRPMVNHNAIVGTTALTSQWGEENWVDWYRVMETMIRTWPAYVKSVNESKSVRHPLTHLYPPYEWSTSQWWKGWQAWDARQRALHKATKPRAPGAKKSFL